MFFKLIVMSIFFSSIACKTTTQQTPAVEPNELPKTKKVATLALSQISSKTLQEFEPNSQKPINIVFNSIEDAQAKCAQLATEGITCTILSPEEADSDIGGTNQWILETDNAPPSLGLTNTSNNSLSAQETTGIVAGAVAGIATVSLAVLALRSHYTPRKLGTPEFKPTEFKKPEPKRPENTPDLRTPKQDSPVVARAQFSKPGEPIKDASFHSQDALRLRNEATLHQKSAERILQQKPNATGAERMKINEQAAEQYQASGDSLLKAGLSFKKAAELTSNAAEKADLYRWAATIFSSAKNIYAKAEGLTENTALKAQRVESIATAKAELHKVATAAQTAGIKK